MLLLCVCCEKVASSKETAIKFLKCKKVVLIVFFYLISSSINRNFDDYYN